MSVTRKKKVDVAKPNKPLISEKFVEDMYASNRSLFVALMQLPGLEKYLYSLRSLVTRELAVRVLVELGKTPPVEGRQERLFSDLARSLIIGDDPKGTQEKYLVRVLKGLTEAGFIERREAVVKTKRSEPKKKKSNVFYGLDYEHMAASRGSQNLLDQNSSQLKRELSLAKGMLVDLASIDEVKAILVRDYGTDDPLSVLESSLKDDQTYVNNLDKEVAKVMRRFFHILSRA